MKEKTIIIKFKFMGGDTQFNVFSGIYSAKLFLNEFCEEFDSKDSNCKFAISDEPYIDLNPFEIKETSYEWQSIDSLMRD